MSNPEGFEPQSVELATFPQITFPMSLTAPSKRGRPRKYANGAEKQAAYRNRVKRRTDEKIKQGEILKALAENPDNRGKYMTDAPHGKGLLVSGGYGREKVEQVLAKSEQARRVGELGGTKRSKGHGPEDFSGHETKFTFTDKIRFPKKWKLSDTEKEEIIADFVEENFEIPETSTATEWNPETKTYDMIPGTYQCKECDCRVDWWHEAVEHFVTAHAKLLRQEIRERQPKCIS